MSKTKTKKSAPARTKEAPAARHKFAALPVGEAKAHHIGFRLNDAQTAELARRASSAARAPGMDAPSVSEMARAILIDVLSRPDEKWIEVSRTPGNATPGRLRVLERAEDVTTQRVDHGGGLASYTFFKNGAQRPEEHALAFGWARVRWVDA